MNGLFLRFSMAAIVFMLVITACNAGAPVPMATLLPTTTDTLEPPSATATSTLTPTPIPMLSVNGTVDCYAGPTDQYDNVIRLDAGTELQIVGTFGDNSFWIVTTSDGKECWLAKEQASVIAGEPVALPQVIPPATPTLEPPAAPSDLNTANRCTLQLIKFRGKTERYVLPGFVITWKDNANNEDGYIIYKDDVEVKRLPADSTQYSDQIESRFYIRNYQGPIMYYAIASYNAVGISEKVKIMVRVFCQ